MDVILTKNITLDELIEFYNAGSHYVLPEASNGKLKDVIKIKIVSICEPYHPSVGDIVFFKFTNGTCYETVGLGGNLGGISTRDTRFDIIPEYSLGDLYER